MLKVGDLVLDGSSREVTRGGEEISLTVTEFELLRYLMRNPRRAISRTEILDRVWNWRVRRTPSVVDLYISYLRRKIDAGRKPMIHTVGAWDTCSDRRSEPAPAVVVTAIAAPAASHRSVRDRLRRDSRGGGDCRDQSA